MLPVSPRRRRAQRGPACVTGSSSGLKLNNGLEHDQGQEVMDGEKRATSGPPLNLSKGPAATEFSRLGRLGRACRFPGTKTVPRWLSSSEAAAEALSWLGRRRSSY